MSTTPASRRRIHVLASENEVAQKAAEELSGLYFTSSLEKADVVLALGGDGFMLETLHKLMDMTVFENTELQNTGNKLADQRSKPLPVYGMNLGTVGFLMNEYKTKDLLERIEKAKATTLYPLCMETFDLEENRLSSLLAINDVSLLRESPQTAHMRVEVDGITRIERLIGDGVLVATSAGSTAYNASVSGPILPIGVGVLALTPISCARPKRWPGALLPDTTKIVLEVLDAKKRPVSATADNQMVRDVKRVEIALEKSIQLELLFDPGHNLEERILKEQFLG